MVRKRKSPQQAIREPTGLPQGQRQALVQAQQAVPLPNNEERLSRATEMAGMMPMGDATLRQPTANPDEPITTGMAIGPGMGPSAVPPMMRPEQQDNAGMARYLPMLEAMADDPGASMATRNFVRRVRGSIPANVTQQALLGQDGLS